MRAKKKQFVWWLAFVASVCVVLLQLPIVKAEAARDQGENARSVKFYGAQLNGEQQEVYAALQEKYLGEDGLSNGITSKLHFTPSEEVRAESADDLSHIIVHATEVFLADHPQLFWAGTIEVSVSYQKKNVCKLTGADIQFREKYPGASSRGTIAQYNVGVRTAVKDIFSSLPEDATVYHYYKAAHDWVCETAEYDSEAAEYVQEAAENEKMAAYRSAYSSAPVFAGDGKMVCQGYGDAFQVLCDQLQIQRGQNADMPLSCVKVTGTGKDEDGFGPHLWNAVKMPDGKWYAVDTTWDDQNPVSYAYFLCGRDTIGFHGSTFGEDHIEDTELDYPELALSAYSGDGSEQVIEDVRENDTAGQSNLPEQSELLRQMEQASVAVLRRCIEETERCVAFLEENKEWLLPRAGIVLAVLVLLWVLRRIGKRRK